LRISKKFRWIIAGAISLIAVLFFIEFFRELRIVDLHDIDLRDCPIGGLPRSATHISCYYGGFGPVRLYDFGTTEADFHTWAKDNGWKLKTFPSYQSGDSFQIERHGKESDANPWHAELHNGYVYEWVSPDASDDRLVVAYDLDNHHAYYARSYR
jgi:hypothetical protein